MIRVPDTDGWRRRPLQGAIDRLDLSRSRRVRGVRVTAPGGVLAIAFELEGGRRRGARAAERTFAHLWYDAFGEQEPRHSGEVVGVRRVAGPLLHRS